VGKVVFDQSMSLDGFTTGPNPRPEEPNGDGGMRLIEWAFEGGEEDRGLLEEAVAGLGAVIAGRRTYDLSVPFWGPGGPTGEARAPVFVVTHEPPVERAEDAVSTFVTAGIEAALEQAKAVAADKDVCVMGGAGLGRQYLDAGLVDELSIHLVPVLLGDGTRMFDAQRLPLEPVAVVGTTAATHVRYRVVR
jgi:dihydrofolate reductase